MDKNKLAVNMFNNSAKLYEAKYMDISAYSESLDLFCEKLGNKSANILEIACGPGNITKYILNKSPKYQILGTDLAPEMIDLARKNCPSATFEIFDSRDIIKLNKLFDAIISGFLFPYLNQEEVKSFISDTRQSLKTGGLLYISTMHGEYNESGVKKSSTSGDEVYFYYHNVLFLKETLINNEFEIIETKIKTDPTDSDVTDLIILAKRK